MRMCLSSTCLRVQKLVAFVVVFGAVQSLSPMAQAQQLSTGSGLAPRVDVVEAAQRLNMQDPYARAIYLFIRSNPTYMDNPQFYVGFLAYLLSTTPDFDCREAFANEFERRDYFTQAFALKDRLTEVVSTVTIPQRFDVGYTIDTGRYDFTSSTLPFSNIRSVGSEFNYSISSNNAQSCASQMLSGTTVDINLFPWQFEVVNETGEQGQPQFPFGQSLQVPDADARVLFQQFGRQLYAIVSYQFQAANNGDRKVQIIPTDGQLFGLASDAVVRVKSFQHPTLSQAQYFDITNPLSISVAQIGLEADLKFQQQGFRAVGEGIRQDPGTDITLGGTFPVGGSAAVGNSTFIMRLAVPRLISSMPGLNNQPTAERFLTLFGSINFSDVTQASAPVTGVAIVLQIEQDGTMRQTQPFYFSGAFRPDSEAATAPAETASTLLDDTPVTETPQDN